MTFSAITSETKLTPTSQYLSINLFLSLFFFIALLDICMGLMASFFNHWSLGIYLFFCGAIYVASDRRRRQRRYRVASFLRPVRGLQVSKFLLYENWHKFRLVNFLFVAVLAYLAGGEFGPVGYLIYCIVGSALIMPAPAALLALVKYHFDQDFRIVLFRRDSKDIAFAHKSIIMPACGLFGQVLLILDETLSSFMEAPLDRLAFWWLSEMYYPLVPHGFDYWKKVVMIELTYADFAVLDWSGEVTANMRWELNQALLALPAHRILLIVGSDNDLNGPENTFIPNSVKGLLMAPSPSSPLRRLLFLQSLESAVSGLGPEPRKASMVARAKCLSACETLDDIDWPSFENAQ